MGVFDKKDKISEVNEAVDKTITKTTAKKEVDTLVAEKQKYIEEHDDKFYKTDTVKKLLGFSFKKHVPPKGTSDKDGNYMMPSVVELQPKIDWARVSMWLSVFGIIAIIMITQNPTYQNHPALVILLFFFGITCFLFFGLVLGWLFLNIDMRCKIMRMMTRGRKNYGIMYLVLKGGRQITSRIVNFDGDVLVNEMRMWIIDKKGMHYIDRDGKKQFWAEVTSDNIKTMPANIPALFLDYDTMVPLKFYKEVSDSKPQQVAANILGYVANQIAKMLFFKKTMTFFYLIIIILTCLGLVVSMQCAMWVSDINNVVPKLDKKIDDLMIRIGILQHNITMLTNVSDIGGDDLPPPPT